MFLAPPLRATSLLFFDFTTVLPRPELIEFQVSLQGLESRLRIRMLFAWGVQDVCTLQASALFYTPDGYPTDPARTWGQANPVLQDSTVSFGQGGHEDVDKTCPACFIGCGVGHHSLLVVSVGTVDELPLWSPVPTF